MTNTTAPDITRQTARLTAAIDGAVKAWEDGECCSPAIGDYMIYAGQCTGLDLPDDEQERIADAAWEYDATGVTGAALAEFLIVAFHDSAAR